MRHLLYIMLSALLMGACHNSSHSFNKNRCVESEAFEMDKTNGLIKVYEAVPKGYSDTYQRLMKVNYNVEIVKTDLFGLPQEMQCYNQFSIPYIYESFGDSVFIKNKLLANQMDREGLGDQPAKMNGKTDSVLNFFYQRIDPVFYKEFMNNQRNELRLYAQLYTNENGYIYDLYESGVKKHPLDSVLISLAKEVPYKLTPAIDDGKPAKGLVQIFFRLNENSIAIYEAFKEN